jgi:hypothetical protein
MIHNSHTLCRRPSEPLPLRCQSIRPRAQHGSIFLHPVARVTLWAPPFSNLQCMNLKIKTILATGQDRHYPNSSINIQISVDSSYCWDACSSHKLLSSLLGTWALVLTKLLYVHWCVFGELQFHWELLLFRYKVCYAYKSEGRGLDSRRGNWFFTLPNPSSFTMALGTTKRMTEMSMRNLPGE